MKINWKQYKLVRKKKSPKSLIISIKVVDKVSRVLRKTTNALKILGKTIQNSIDNNT